MSFRSYKKFKGQLLSKQVIIAKNRKRKIKHRLKRRKIFLKHFKKIKLSRKIFFVKYKFKRLFKNFFTTLILLFFRSLKIFFFKVYKKFSLNFLLLFKKKNLFFKKKIFSKNIKSKLLDNKKNLIKSRPYSKYINLKIYEKNKLNNTKTKSKKIKIYSIKHHFLKAKMQNISLLKTFFFKKELIKKKIDSFLKNIGTFNYSFYKSINKMLYINLIRSHFFFFIFDVKFFIKQHFIFINGESISNPLYLLKLGDVVQVPLMKKYFRYQKSTFLYFKKKLKFLRYQRWKMFQKSFVFSKFSKWNPKFLKNFFFYKVDTPKFLEIDYTCMSAILINNNNNYNYKCFFNKLVPYYLVNSYNWKRIT